MSLYKRLHEVQREATGPRRASIAIMPFIDLEAGREGKLPLARGLSHDLITRLAKLRTVFEIAQGTVFALAEKGVSAEEAGRLLNVDYVASGTLRNRDGRVSVSVELVETRCARIVWSDTIERRLSDSLSIEDEVVNEVVSSIASEIELTERNRAILKPPGSLDAWEALHCGFWHMYRFNEADNERAKRFFKLAVRLDPTFSRAYAGLSFTHWQNAFQGWAKRGPEADRAFEMAGQSLLADDRDPAAHWAMGRALWLRGSQDQSLVEFGQAVELSPNFAVAHYNVAFVNATSGDSDAAISSSDYARDLSPFDPMLFGMLGARAMALVRLGQFEEAAEWAVKAAARPNAHAHILGIAAYCLALAGRLDEARSQLATLRRTLPHYGADDFLTAMHFEPQGAALFRQAAKRIG